MHFTDQRVRSLVYPEKGQKEYADDAVNGLSLVVGKTAKTFRLVVGTRIDRKRFTLGRYDPPHFTLAMAREKARDILARERLQETQLPRTTFKEASKLYDRLHLSSLRPSTARDMRRTLDRECARLANVALADITRRDIAPILDDMLDRPEAMGAVFRHLRAFFRWCVGRGYLETVPTDRMSPPRRGESRGRVLSPGELVAIWNALPDDNYGHIIKLSILSGQRRGQWAGVRRDYLRDDVVVWPREAMKIAREHALPLTPAIKALLPERIGHLFPTAGGIPFNNWAACKRRLDEASGVSEWRHHDLRRTWATVAADELDVQPHIIESVLAHSIGSQVARTYNRAKYLDPMRRALIAFEEWLQIELSKLEGTNGRDIPGLHGSRA